MIIDEVSETSIRAAVRLATVQGDVDGWWYRLTDRLRIAHVAAVVTFADREASECVFRLRERIRVRSSRNSNRTPFPGKSDA